MAKPKSTYLPLLNKLSKGKFKPRSYNPNELWNKAVDYIEWVENNPLYERKAFSNALVVDLPKMRAMTISGFCVYAGIHRDTFYAYEQEAEYSDICARIRDIFFDQKFTGAAAGLLEPNIVARELGLVDKQEIKQDATAVAQIVFDKRDEKL